MVLVSSPRPPHPTASRPRLQLHPTTITGKMVARTRTAQEVAAGQGPERTRSALPASRSSALARPRAAPRATAEGSTAQDRRSATPIQPCADAPDHPTSFPLQFYQRLGSQAGDRRPALTRISPQIARYSPARLPRARRPRLSFVSAWPHSLGFPRRPPRSRDILLRASPSN